VLRDYPLASPEVEELRALIREVQTPYLNVATEQWAMELRR
jgi:oxaloacetate decarboxylase alpha subunit